MAEAQTQYPEQPALFRATYYVDPAFTGIQLGSQANPFVSANAAFAAMLALGLTVGTIKLSPGCNLTENVVMPSTGADWEIRCDHQAVGGVAATITGTVTCTSAAACRYRLTSLRVTGAISGNSAASNQLVLNNVVASSTVTCTGSWAGVSFTGNIAPNLNSFGGAVSGAVSVAGPIFALNYAFLAAIDWASNGTQFYACRFGTGSFTLNGIVGVQFFSAVFAAAITFTSASNNTITLDSASMASALNVGVTVAGAGVITVSTISSNKFLSTSLANNQAPTNVAGKAPVGLYSAAGVLDLVATGAGTGTATQNVIYVDRTGATITRPVCTLLVTAAAGTEGSGDVVFYHNGGAAIQTSVTGVVPGAGLSFVSDIAVTKLD